MLNAGMNLAIGLQTQQISESTDQRWRVNSRPRQNSLAGCHEKKGSGTSGSAAWVQFRAARGLPVSVLVSQADWRGLRFGEFRFAPQKQFF